MSRFDAPLGNLIAQLDRVGFDVGSHRVSVWNALLVVVVLIAVVLVARLGTLAARRALGRIHRLDATQRLLGEKLVSIAIWAAAILVGIDLLGIDLTALAVFSGAFGLAIGFGLQKTFGNLIAGIILLMDRSIKPGDVIAIKDGNANAVGQVKKIGIRAVSVTTRDKKEFLIPNEILMTTQVENWSYSSKEVRVRVPLTIAYGNDLELAKKLMSESAKAARRVLDTPPPAVWITDFSDAGIAFEIRIWINDPEEGLGSVRSDVLERVWQAFTAHGIALPDPGARNVRMVDDRRPGDFA